ncbi:hypothetical protein Hanom_Chr01g00004571 [Helianthus anomalus]
MSETNKLCSLSYFTSKLSKWYLRFHRFCHFSLKVKLFEYGSLWFQFCCHFHPKAKSDQIFQLRSSFFVFFSPL